MLSRSLALRVLLLNLALVVLPMMVYFLLFARYEYKNEVGTYVRRIRDTTLLRASYLTQVVEDQFIALDYIESMMELDRPEIIDNLAGLDRHLPLPDVYSLVNFLVRTPEGRYISKYATIQEEIGRDLTYRGYLQEAVRNNYSADLIYDDLNLTQEFVISKAIYSRANYQLVGVLSIVFPGKFIFDTLTEDKYFTSGETASLLTSDKIVFASSNDQLLFTAFAPLTEAQKNELKINKQFGTYVVPKQEIQLHPYSNMRDVFEWVEKGRTHIAFMAPVFKGAFSILVDIDKDTLAKPYRESMLLTLLVLIGITTASCLATFVIGYLLSSTLRELKLVMNAVATGNFALRYQKKFLGFEINEVGMKLNKTLDRLVQETKEAETELLKTASVSQQLRIGREIQYGLITRELPLISGLEVAVYYRSDGDMSGEFYDIYEQEGALVVTLTSTSKKGLLPCLLSFDLRSIFRSFVAVSQDASWIMEKTNTMFHGDLKNSSLVVRSFLGFWNPTTSQFTYSCAGLSFGFVCFPDGTIESLSGFQIPIGSQEKIVFPSYSLNLPSGTMIVLYTPGVIEQQNGHGNFYGEEGLKTFISGKIYLSSQEIVQQLEAEFMRAGDNLTHKDDMTVIVMKFVAGETHA